MQRKQGHAIRLGGGEIGRRAAVLAGVGMIALAAGLTLVACSTSQPGRPSAGRETAGRPTLAVTSFAGYPGGLPLAGAPRLAVNAIADGGGQRLAVGSADGHPAVWRQGTGGTWALVTSLSGLPARSGGAALTSVAYGPAGWLAVGVPGPVVLSSANGTTWRPAAGHIAAHLGKISVVSAAGGPRGYVILGKLAVPGHGCVADVWWSPDLTSWTRAHDVNDVAGSSQTLAVAAVADGFVSVGSHQGKPAAWLTSDGVTWRTLVLPGPRNAQLSQIAAIGDRVVATGGSDGQGAGAAAFAVSSADGGASWRQEALQLPQPDTVVTALAAGSQGFVAAGQYGMPGRQHVAVWELATGSGIWTPAHVAGITGPGTGRTHEITALGPSSDAVTGVGPLAPAANDQAVIFTLPAR
jgi:hypothetical protein